MQTNSIKRLWLILSVFILGLPAVAAQGAFGNLGGTMQSMFGPVLLSFGTGNFLFWGKFMLWILIFALLYAVTFKIPVINNRKNIQVVTAVIIALIAVIPLKEPLIKGMFQTYAVMASFIIIFAPIAGVLYLSHKMFSDHKRLHYAMKAILFYLLAVIVSNITGAVQATFDLGFATGFQNMAGFAIGICFLMFLWNFFRALLGGPEESPRQNIAQSSNTPGWLSNLLSDNDTPRPTTTNPPTPLPANLGQALRVIQDNIRGYERVFNTVPPVVDRLLTARMNMMFPPPGTVHPIDPRPHNQAMQQFIPVRRDLSTRTRNINNMLRQIVADNPQMNPGDARRLADLSGLWQARIFITNNYMTRYRNSYAIGGGPIGRP